MKNNVLYFLLLGLGLMLISCDDNDEMESQETELTVALQEISGRLNLRFETLDEYPCANYSIQQITEEVGGTPQVDFGTLTVVEPMGCLTAFGPALTYLDMGILDVGTHPLELILNGIVAEGSVTVSEDLYSLTIEDEKGFEVVLGELPK